MSTSTKKSFNTRGFVSTAMCTAALVLPFSGIMNHVLQFDPMTMERHFWMTAHNVSALLFTVFMTTHIVLNRRTLLRQMKRLGGMVTKEAAIATLLVIGIVGLISTHVFHAR